MEVSEQTHAKLHSKLPIDKDETVVAVYRHHWFAYAMSWIIAVLAVVVLMGATFALTGGSSGVGSHRSQIIALAGVFCVLILLGAAVPAYLKSQEQLVLTDESLLQVLRPTIFASKVDSLGLQRVDDVAVRQDFLGTIFGYGHVTVETPGEQDNYEFFVAPHPQDIAREITATKENFEAALNSGRLPSTMGSEQNQAPQIDPQQYQQFLQYQQMVAQQQAENNAQPTPSQPQANQPQAPQQDNEQSPSQGQ